MNEFWLYVEVGYRHILDIQAYDHLVFLLALTAVFVPGQWRSLLICLTAFTLGHSLTLVLSMFEVFEADPAFVELIIPLSIMLTALLNTFERSGSRPVGFGESKRPSTFTLRYLLALLFGLIHGMGFSGYLKNLLLQEQDLVLPLAGFNIGIELGQVVFVLFIFSGSFVFVSLLNKSKYHWNLFLSGAALGIGTMLFIEQLL